MMMRRLLSFAALVAVGSWAPGCSVFSPPPADYVSIDELRARLDAADLQAAKMPDYVPLSERVLWYVPNRLLDIVDLFKVSIGAGPGTGLELYISENAWASYLNYRTWRLGWDGRAVGVYDEGHFRQWRLNDWHLHNPRGELSDGRVNIFSTSNLRPFEAPLRDGVPAVGEVPKNAWDIGAQIHFLLGAEVLVRPFELIDLIVGLWGDDIADDDFGVRYYPIHEYNPRAEILDILVNAIDSLNEEDLRKTLSIDLVKDSLIGRQGKVVLLDENGTAAKNALAAQGDRDAARDFVLIGGVRFRPDDYRKDGNLQVSYRCTGAYLRFNTPARFDYRLQFVNDYLRSFDEFDLSLEIADSPYQDGNHWVVTRLSPAPVER